MAVETFDGDEIRQNLHPDLGFTREDRRINNRRTAFICNLLNKNGISTVTGMITPFREAQRQARDIIEPNGTFVLIYVKCLLETCIERDPKGLYKQAQEGKIENFTGISHPFQPRTNPDIVADTETYSEGECLNHIKSELHEYGLFTEKSKGSHNLDITKEKEMEIRDRLRDLGYL